MSTQLVVFVGLVVVAFAVFMVLAVEYVGSLLSGLGAD